MNPEQIPLRELHLPEPIGWWPPAPGWWLLAAVVVAVIAYNLWHMLRAWRRAAARRVARAELARHSRGYRLDRDAGTLAREASALLRRLMLAYVPRGQVAGLTGDDWLRFLDRGLPGAPFSKGPGRQLTQLPYRADAANTAADVEALLDAINTRLRTPLPEERA